MLFQQGETTDFVYVIIEGEFEVQIKRPNQDAQQMKKQENVRKTFNKWQYDQYGENKMNNTSGARKSTRESSLINISDYLKEWNCSSQIHRGQSQRQSIQSPMRNNMQRLMKLTKDHVIGLSQIYCNRVSSYSLMCNSIHGGYVLAIPINDVEKVLNMDDEINAEFNNYAIEE